MRALVFKIIFGIDFKFFDVLPIQLKICRSNKFSLSQGKTCASEKSGRLQGFWADRVPNLPSPVKKNSVKENAVYYANCKLRCQLPQGLFTLT